jgi:hypothetical protein
LHREDTRQLEYARNTGRIIVGAVMNLAFFGRETTSAAMTEMIIVSANYYCFAFQRGIGAFEDANHVRGVCFAPYKIGSNRDPRRLKWKLQWRLCICGWGFRSQALLYFREQ